MSKNSSQHNKIKRIRMKNIGDTLLLTLAVLICYNLGYIIGKLIF